MLGCKFNTFLTTEIKPPSCLQVIIPMYIYMKTVKSLKINGEFYQTKEYKGEDHVTADALKK